MQSTTEANGSRSTGIDTVRGLLVLGVILGHYFEITQGEGFPAWIGAGVRMPLFIGLTGYLFNLERARAASLMTLLRRQYPRLILPWAVACVVHTTVTNEIHVGTPLSLLLWPPFHLWFVPVMMAFIVMATASRLPPATMLAIAIPVSIAAMYLLGVGHVPTSLYGWLPDRRFFIYPIYFFYGLYVAVRRPDPIRRAAAMVLAPLGFLWWCSLYDTPGIAAEAAAEIIGCLPMIYLLPVVRTIRIPLPAIATIGRNSLFFYLWHPMAFALWRLYRVEGAVLLALTIATLVILLPLLARYVSIARILGIAQRLPPAVPLPPAFDTPARKPA